MESSVRLEDKDLLEVEKPAQYLGGERNAVIKDLEAVNVRFALAFPDTYEVGMSHLGIQILYHIINEIPDAWAERVYTPLPDMEAILRNKQLPLATLESKAALAEFDIVGFSLQYELCATNILTMLDLGGIPLYAEERGDEDPIVIGGGPYTYHPEALSPFFDAFFLGDAEEFLPEFIEIFRKEKAQALPGRRARLLKALSEMEGLYLPQDFTPVYNDHGTLLRIEAKNSERKTVLRRLLPTMEGAPFPKRPVVPNINTIHNRLSVEVMRGCVRGCRFCQAGYLYRPQRERSPKEILNIIQDALPETGFEEVSLLSLSTADYCSVVPLLKSLMDSYGEGETLSVSFPSTRVDALKPELLEQVQRVRRTGFTIAPEAGTQRLRDVINKGVSDEQILETCGNVYRMGWTGVKTYFMLGLPTETDEDLYGIIDIAARIKALPEARGKDLTVSVSTHVPKPHTPFQWAAQITPEETIRKQRLLADGLRRLGVTFRYHDNLSSFLEGIFCRAGRELAPAIVKAYQNGARLDAWGEHLKESVWMQAFADCGLDPYHYLRERSVEEALPWDHLSAGISKEYFAKEYRRALRDKTTPDCLTQSCSICGACNYDDHRNVLWPRAETERLLNIEVESGAQGAELYSPAILEQSPVQRLRVAYTKQGPFRYLGHLELSKVIQRTVRRAELPICFSKGFHPLPRISFGPPLSLGVSSREEYLELHLGRSLSPLEVEQALMAELPSGLSIRSITEVSLKAPSLQDSIVALQFRVRWLSMPQGLLKEVFSQQVVSTRGVPEDISRLYAVEILREKKKSNPKRRKAKSKPRTFRLQETVFDVHFKTSDNVFPDLLFSIRQHSHEAAPNAIEIVKAWSELSIGDYELEKTASILREPELPSVPSVESPLLFQDAV